MLGNSGTDRPHRHDGFSRYHRAYVQVLIDALLIAGCAKDCVGQFGRGAKVNAMLIDYRIHDTR
jgi:hypothetical protein